MTARWDRSARYTAWLRDGELRAAVEVSGSGEAWWWRVQVCDCQAVTLRETHGSATRAATARRDAERAAREALAHVVRARGGA